MNKKNWKVIFIGILLASTGSVSADGEHEYGVVQKFDLNHDGSFDESDMKAIDTDGDGNDDTYLIPGGKRSNEGVIQPPSILTNTDVGKEFKYSSGSTGNIETTVENPSGYTKGRKSWVQLK